jgi:imidazolonepropionase-like amidohydrolase
VARALAGPRDAFEALQTATLNPARHSGKLSDYGSVQPGRVADLVLLEANPLSDIRDTRPIVGVVADGRHLSAVDLDQLRARLRRVAATR